MLLRVLFLALAVLLAGPIALIYFSLHLPIVLLGFTLIDADDGPPLRARVRSAAAVRGHRHGMESSGSSARRCRGNKASIPASNPSSLSGRGARIAPLEVRVANLARDVRFAFRLLLRNPGVALVAIVRWRSASGPIPRSLPWLRQSCCNRCRPRHRPRSRGHDQRPAQRALTENPGTSRLNFEDLRSQANVFSDTSIMAFTPIAMAGGGEPEQVFGQLVSGSFFDRWAPRWRQAAASGPRTIAISGPGRSPCCPTGSGSGGSAAARTLSGRPHPQWPSLHGHWSDRRGLPPRRRRSAARISGCQWRCTRVLTGLGLEATTRGAASCIRAWRA